MVIYLCLIAFCLGITSLVIFYYLPARIVLGATITLCFVLLAASIYLINRSNTFHFKNEATILLGLISLVLLISLALYRNALPESIDYLGQLKVKFECG